MGLEAGFKRHLMQYRSYLREISARLLDPKRKIYDFRLKIDDCTSRLNRMISNNIIQNRVRYRWRTERLFSNSPLSYINTFREILKKDNNKLFNLLLIYYNNQRHFLIEMTSKLGALNPKAILDRGYSITRTIPDAVVVRDARRVKLEQNLEVLLSKGSIKCRVKRKFNDAKKNV